MTKIVRTPTRAAGGITDEERIRLKAHADLYQSADDPLLAWIKVHRPAKLVHQRPHDTHETIQFRRSSSARASTRSAASASMCPRGSGRCRTECAGRAFDCARSAIVKAKGGTDEQD